ncbi:MAG TPA: hypothetical protein VLC91_15070, partial [Spongiibacteraceae bacterium]|nr:hypothetical protein [Spongiibacteraceae bacterium]
QLLNRLANPPLAAPPVATPIVIAPRRRHGTKVAALILIVASIAYGSPEIVQRLALLPAASWAGLAIAALLLLRR